MEFEEEAAAEVLVVDAEEAARRGNRFRVPFPRSDMLPGDGRFEIEWGQIRGPGPNKILEWYLLFQTC